MRNCAGFCSRWVATAGVPIRIVRNFGILKMRLRWPTRSDQYRTGPGEVRRTVRATMSSGNARMTVAIRASRRSNSRFMMCVCIPYQF
ncbi:hypothetical protein D3C72_2373300 [compost metagenome]